MAGWSEIRGEARCRLPDILELRFFRFALSLRVTVPTRGGGVCLRGEADGGGSQGTHRRVYREERYVDRSAVSGTGIIFFVCDGIRKIRFVSTKHLWLGKRAGRYW